MNKKYGLLIVDDELANLQKLQRAFIGQYNIYSALSGEEALKILENTPVDAIITDQKMPDMTGIELLEISQKNYPNLVRIILTGFTDVEDLIAAINTGKVHKYITKPWEPEALRLAIQEALEKMELLRENERLAKELQAANEQLRNENIILRREVENQVSPKNIIYGSSEMGGILQLLRRVTATETTVLNTMRGRRQS